MRPGGYVPLLVLFAGIVTTGICRLKSQTGSIDVSPIYRTGAWALASEGAPGASPGLRNPCALVDASRARDVASGAVCHGV